MSAEAAAPHATVTLIGTARVGSAEDAAVVAAEVAVAEVEPQAEIATAPSRVPKCATRPVTETQAIANPANVTITHARTDTATIEDLRAMIATIGQVATTAK